MPVAELPISASTSPRRSTFRGLPIREDALYTDAKGRENLKARQRAEVLLEPLSEILLRVLEPGETVFCVTSAQVMPGTFEQLFLGWHVYTLPRVVLVFTDRKVISLRVRGGIGLSMHWDRGICTVRWGDITSIKSSGLISSQLRIGTRSGESLAFSRIKGGDGKKIKQFTDVLSQQGSGEASATGAPNSLCPACLAILFSGRYECPQCGLVFKDEKTLFWRGTIIPGGASFYAGLTALGVLRAIAECGLLILLAGELLLVFSAPHGSAESRSAISGAAFVLLLLLLDKAVAIWFCRRQIRGFLPAN